MSRWNTTGRVALIALMGASALALSGCGKRGVLETPPPLFGDRAREQQAQDAADSRARKSTSTAVADQPDNAPLTTRDIKAPEQKNIPVSRQPLDGAPNPLGPAIDPRAPGS
jgi:predicted small lipoprotein YifL